MFTLIPILIIILAIIIAITTSKGDEKMLLDVMKKVGIIISIAILFTVFSVSLTEAVFENPEYKDYCERDQYGSQRYYYDKPMGMEDECADSKVATSEEIQECSDKNGEIWYDTDDKGCSTGHYCETCMVGYEEAQKNKRQNSFIMASILGLIAVIIGLYVKNEEPVMQSILSGFIVGGLLTIFISTMSFYGDMDRFLKPIVMALEIGLIILVALKSSRKAKSKAQKK